MNIVVYFGIVQHIQVQSTGMRVCYVHVYRPCVVLDVMT